VAYSQQLGYQPGQLADAPLEANLGLGCGNPTALASLRPGEVVVDLGAGAGLDAFIAAKAVGPTGRVIGIDMTTEMLARARANAVQADVAGYVEFREGIIEALPVVSDSVDVIISNCVINLSPDKAQVFREAFRVLKPGGRLAVSDIVLTAPLPQDIQQLADAYVGCVGGAMLADDYLGAIREAGFVDVKWESTSAAPILQGIVDNPTAQGVVDSIGAERLSAIAETVMSYAIEARKP
jgi:SAM-dependent methyltransferase